jgi:hypothetical protein
MTVEYAVLIPENWTPEAFEDFRNQGSWCANNVLSELEALVKREDACLCGQTEFAFVREATEEDETLDSVFVEKSKS